MLNPSLNPSRSRELARFRSQIKHNENEVMSRLAQWLRSALLVALLRLPAKLDMQQVLNN